jgi:hypothetical protein
MVKGPLPSLSGLPEHTAQVATGLMDLRLESADPQAQHCGNSSDGDQT